MATLTGEAADTSLPCALFGGTTPFDGATLSSLYDGKQAYLDAFDEALDRANSTGFVRSADRNRYAAEARSVDW